MSQQNGQGKAWQPDYFAIQSAWLKNPTSSADSHLRYEPIYKSPNQNAPAEDTADHGRAKVDAQGDQHPSYEGGNEDDRERTPEGDPEPEDTIFMGGAGDVNSDEEHGDAERPDIMIRPTALMNFERNILQSKKPSFRRKVPTLTRQSMLGMRDLDDEVEDDDDDDGSEDDNDERISAMGEGEDGQPPRKKRRWLGPRGPGTGTKRGPRKAAPMAPDVAKRMGEANNHWMAGDFERAVEVALDVIRINAETYQAWILLATIWDDEGKLAKAANALFYAAHLRPKHLEAWMTAANYCLERTGNAKESFYPTASQCLSFALRQIPNSYEPRIKKARLNFIRGKYQVAVSDFNKALKLRPHDREVLRELANACFEYGLATDGIGQYQKTISHLRSVPDETGAQFSWEDTVLYVSLLEYDDRWEEAIKEIRSISRWLLGREDEVFWDDVTDNDCEWDVDDSRRKEILEFNPLSYPLSTYGASLILELRVRLGINRLNLGHFEEAMLHFSYLDPHDERGQQRVVEYPQLFREVADSLFEATYYEEALVFYKPLRQVPEIVDTKMLNSMGKCAHELGSLSEAEEYHLAAALDADDVESRSALARIYDALGDKQSAFNMINEIVLLNRNTALLPEGFRRQNPKLPTSETIRALEESGAESFLQPAVVRKTKGRKKPEDSSVKDRWGYGYAILKAQRLQEEFKTAEKNRDLMRAGDPGATAKWMEATEELINDFKRFKAFYPWEKYVRFTGYSKANFVEGYASLTEDLSAMAERLSNDKDVTAGLEGSIESQFEVSDKYRGIPFATWLDFFMEFAMFHARKGDLKKAYAMCQAAADSIVWSHSQDDTFVIHLCMCMCSIFANDERTALDASKHFTKKFQFTTDSYRLTSALARVVHSPLSWYCGGPMQKYILRQIKLMDYSLVDEEGKKKITEKGSYFAVDEHGRPIVNTDMDINLLMMYGYILYSSNSYSLALNYFFRCYALDPQNAVINLMIGLAYISDCLKRQTENRQYSVLQGTTFMLAYYETRKNSKHLEERQEAHYNMARAYHMLGLPHLALPYYQKVLDEVSHGTPRSMREDIVVDTAYNLQLMYTTAGNLELARQITKRWLVI
ncbi:transcription factor TFIIIC subunit tfc4 [Cadophora gregata f. sp. sojae]|nr:transcription factor TFIIIC subunit tfc4 [Cadophora gregata f. sp. sojae]